jgi:hypothetical protein
LKSLEEEPHQEHTHNRDEDPGRRVSNSHKENGHQPENRCHTEQNSGVSIAHWHANKNLTTPRVGIDSEPVRQRSGWQVAQGQFDSSLPSFSRHDIASVPCVGLAVSEETVATSR